MLHHIKGAQFRYLKYCFYLNPHFHQIFNAGNSTNATYIFLRELKTKKKLNFCIYRNIG